MFDQQAHDLLDRQRGQGGRLKAECRCPIRAQQMAGGLIEPGDDRACLDLIERLLEILTQDRFDAVPTQQIECVPAFRAPGAWRCDRAWLVRGSARGR